MLVQSHQSSQQACVLCNRLLINQLTVKHIGLAVIFFYSKTDFWSSYCQISTDLDKILHTPINVVRNTLVGRL